MVLDDDDEFNVDDALSEIYDITWGGRYPYAVYWKCDIGKKVVPAAKWGRKPRLGDVSHMGFAWDSILHAEWDAERYADGRLARLVWVQADHLFIDRLLTRAQVGHHIGNRNE